jgi:hypothetical protein
LPPAIMIEVVGAAGVESVENAMEPIREVYGVLG